MYTRCQACHTVHPVNAAILAQGGGKYRCGKCHKIGNALEALFDEWPQASQQGTRPGSLPELGLPLSLSPGEDTSDASDPAAAPGDALIDETELSPSRKPMLRVLWVGAALVLTVVIALNLFRFFQQPVLDLPWLQSTLTRLGVKQAPPQPVFRAPEQIELLSRELKAHPFRPGVLLLTATIVNRADRSQPYPDIDVTLLDINGRKLNQSLFKPGDYLSHSSELRTGMKPQAQLTFSLDMLDPGDSAVGFELQFR